VNDTDHLGRLLCDIRVLWPHIDTDNRYLWIERVRVRTGWSFRDALLACTPGVERSVGR